jgi:hypothetical protein
MTIYASPAGTLEASIGYGTTGLVGTIRITITDTPTGAVFLASTTTGITESGTRGVYFWTGTGPSTAGTYTVFWDLGSDATTIGSEDLVVSTSSPSVGGSLGVDLCTLAQVREYLQKPGADTNQDGLISAMISRASAAIEEWTQRWLAPRTAVTNTFRVDGLYVDFAPYDLRTATTVSLHPEGTPTVLTANTSYQLLPIGGTDSLDTFTGMMLSAQISTYSSNSTRFGYEQVSVLGNWGPATVPLDVTHACVITVGLWIRREVGAFSATFSPDVDVADTRPLAIPGAAMRMLAPYRRAVIG